MLVVESLSKSYVDAGEPRQILNQAELKLEQGQSLSIIGASGSGKSTLLHLIGALDKADSGRILLKTETNKHYDDINSFTEKQADNYRKQYLGLVFQKFNLIDCISVYDNIALPARLNQCLDQAFVQSLIDQLGIQALVHKLPSDLSGGEQQRVAIARALSHKPTLVLADEPTGNLDASNSETVSKLLVSTCKQNKASLIMVTHSDEVSALTEYKKVLKKGKLEDCPTRTVLKVV